MGTIYYNDEQQSTTPPTVVSSSLFFFSLFFFVFAIEVINYSSVEICIFVIIIGVSDNPPTRRLVIHKARQKQLQLYFTNATLLLICKVHKSAAHMAEYLLLPCRRRVASIRRHLPNLVQRRVSENERLCRSCGYQGQGNGILRGC